MATHRFAVFPSLSLSLARTDASNSNLSQQLQIGVLFVMQEVSQECLCWSAGMPPQPCSLGAAHWPHAYL